MRSPLLTPHVLSPIQKTWLRFKQPCVCTREPLLLMISDCGCLNCWTSSNTGGEDFFPPKKTLVEKTRKLPWWESDPHCLKDFETLTNTVLAKKYGVSRERIRQIRLLLSIPAPAPTKRAMRQPTARWQAHLLSNARINEHAHLLGTLSDHRFADRFNVLPGSVSRERNKRGIPPYGFAPTRKDFVPLDRDMIRSMWADGHSDAEIATAVGSKNPGSITTIRHELGLVQWHRKEDVSDADLKSFDDARARLASAYASGKSQAKIAALIGTQQTAVSKMLNGSLISLKVARRILEHL